MNYITLLLLVGSLVSSSYTITHNSQENSSQSILVCFTDEYEAIRQAANRNDCFDDDFLILLAIRKAENGGKGKEFGVKHERAWNTNLDTQAGWAAATIVKNRVRWRNAGKPATFIEFLGNRYCPKSCDPQGNINWNRNVNVWFNKLKGK